MHSKINHDWLLTKSYTYYFFCRKMSHLKYTMYLSLLYYLTLHTACLASRIKRINVVGPNCINFLHCLVNVRLKYLLSFKTFCIYF